MTKAKPRTSHRSREGKTLSKRVDCRKLGHRPPGAFTVRLKYDINLFI